MSGQQGTRAPSSPAGRHNPNNQQRVVMLSGPASNILRGDYAANLKEPENPLEIGSRDILDWPRRKIEQFHRRPKQFTFVKQTTTPSWYTNFRKFEGPINLDVDGKMPQYHFLDSDGEPESEPDEPPNPYGDESYTSDPSYISVSESNMNVNLSEAVSEKNKGVNKRTQTAYIDGQAGDSNNPEALVGVDKDIDNGGLLSFSSVIHSTPATKRSEHSAFSGYSYGSTNVHLPSTPTGKQTGGDIPSAPTKPRRIAVSNSAVIRSGKNQRSTIDSGYLEPGLRHTESHGTKAFCAIDGRDASKLENRPTELARKPQFTREATIIEVLSSPSQDKIAATGRKPRQIESDKDTDAIQTTLSAPEDRKLSEGNAGDKDSILVIPAALERQVFMFRLGLDTNRDDMIFRSWYMAPHRPFVTRFMYLLREEDENNFMFLWDPKLSQQIGHMSLENKFIPRDLDVGDIGHLDAFGEFHAVFNIFLTREQNIAVGLSPPPRHLPLEVKNYKRLLNIQGPKYYMTGSGVQRINQDPDTFSFSVNPNKGGAIVLLPKGADGYIMNRTMLRTYKDYFFTNVQSWYEHANAQNGSLFCLTSVAFATVWGMLSTNVSTSANIALPKKTTVTYRQHGPNPLNYFWDNPNSHHIETSSGPTLSELRKIGPNDTAPNYCVAVAPAVLWIDSEGEKLGLLGEVKQAFKTGNQLSVPSGLGLRGSSRGPSRSNSPTPSHYLPAVSPLHSPGPSRPSSPMLYSAHPSTSDLAIGAQMPANRFAEEQSSKKSSFMSASKDLYNSFKKSTSRSSKKNKGSERPSDLSVSITKYPTIIDFDAHRTDNYFSEFFNAR